MVHALGGSVAAEHGVGRLKVADLQRYGDPGKLAAMRAIKAALDPFGIMNPGAVLAACMKHPRRREPATGCFGGCVGHAVGSGAVGLGRPDKRQVYG